MQEPNQSPGRVVPLKALIPLLLLTAAVSIAGALALDRLALGVPANEQASVETAEPVDAEEVWSVLEGDPLRLDAALDPAPSDLSGQLEEVTSTVEDVSGTADAAGTAAEEATAAVDELASSLDEVSGEVDDVGGDLRDICGSLSFASALSDVLLDCP